MPLKGLHFVADQIFGSAFGFGKYIDLFVTDKSRYVAQPRPIIVNYLRNKPTSTKCD